MSLFAVGGANAAIPEMHRIAVDVQHWLTDKQFADVYAISQLSPGPNVLIVTLIGYAVAGVAGALAATLCDVRSDRRAGLLGEPPADPVEPCALACHYPGGAGAAFDRADGRQRPGSGADLRPDLGRRAWSPPRVAVLAFATRLNPLWLLLAGGLLGFAGVIG